MRELGGVEAWQAKLASDHGGAAAFVIDHRIVEGDASDAEALEEAVKAMPSNGYELTVAESLGEILRIKVVEVETSSATFVDIPAAIFTDPSYGSLRRAYGKVA